MAINITHGCMKSRSIILSNLNPPIWSILLNRPFYRRNSLDHYMIKNYVATYPPFSKVIKWLKTMNLHHNGLYNSWYKKYWAIVYATINSYMGLMVQNGKCGNKLGIRNHREKMRKNVGIGLQEFSSKDFVVLFENRPIDYSSKIWTNLPNFF